MQSFLNLIDIETGRQIRLAEFGFKAESPSFSGESITFERDDGLYKFDLATGMISKAVICTKRSDDKIYQKHEVKIIFISGKIDGIGHCELNVSGKVLARFMGSEKSIGSCPERDGKIVFIGYPSESGIG